MYSAGEREEFQRSGIRPGLETSRRTFPRRTPRSRLKALAIVSMSSAGTARWYNFVVAASTLAGALTFWAVATVRCPSPGLVRTAILAAAARVIAGLALIPVFAVSPQAILFGVALPTVVAAYAIAMVVWIAREPNTADGAPNPP